MYEQLNLFDTQIKNTKIELISYLEFKEWLLSHFPLFKEVEAEKYFKHSGETFRFEYKKGKLTIELNNAFNHKKDGIDWRPYGQYISLHVDRGDSGYGTWCHELEELEERIRDEYRA